MIMYSIQNKGAYKYKWDSWLKWQCVPFHFEARLSAQLQLFSQTQDTHAL